MQMLRATQVVTMVQGEVNSDFNHQQLLQQVVIDSRKVAANSLFIAIRGETHDGHNFVREVLTANPTAMAIVMHDFSWEHPNLIRVKETTLALGELAQHYRGLFQIPVVAITGSNGKTTVKEMLKNICKLEFGHDAVLATSGNLNNHWGVPLTLLGLEAKHRVAIIEMGMNHSGELSYLSQIAAPTLAVVNNVMLAHAGNFNSLSEIAAAKGEIYSGLAATGIACVNLASTFSQSWLQQLAPQSVFGFGTPASGCYLRELSTTGASYVTPQGELELKLQVLGQHNYLNALTVIALALNLGCSLTAIKTGLESYHGYSGRLEVKSAFNGAVVIDDTYNANPDSVRAALEAIQEFPAPRWFIFADLKELGQQEVEFHYQVGEWANQLGIAKLITVGELARYAATTFNRDKIHFGANQDVVKYCLSALPTQATLLVKGSHSMRLDEVVTGITANPPA